MLPRNCWRSEVYCAAVVLYNSNIAILRSDYPNMAECHGKPQLSPPALFLGSGQGREPDAGRQAPACVPILAVGADPPARRPAGPGAVHPQRPHAGADRGRPPGLFLRRADFRDRLGADGAVQAGRAAAPRGAAHRRGVDAVKELSGVLHRTVDERAGYPDGAAGRQPAGPADPAGQPHAGFAADQFRGAGRCAESMALPAHCAAGGQRGRARTAAGGRLQLSGGAGHTAAVSRAPSASSRCCCRAIPATSVVRWTSSPSSTRCR